MKDPNKLNDLMALFQDSPELSKEEKRLEEVKSKLMDDIAIKSWQGIIDHVKGMIGDVRGQIEAISFCRAYLAELVHLSDEVASEMGVPREVAAILAYRVNDMARMAVEDRYNNVVSSAGFMEAFKDQAKSPDILTDVEVAELEKEKAQLEEAVLSQKDDCKSCDGDCGCHEEANEKFGYLPKENPFGLN